MSQSTEQEKKNFERNAKGNAPKDEDKAEAIKKIQKEEEQKRDIHREDHATHPHNKQYRTKEANKKSENPIRKIAVAESLTAGKIADLLVSHDSASSFFIGSMSVYTLKHKAKLLDVDEKHADEVDCVSPKVASEMSEGILKVFGDDAEVGIGVTGFAQTDGINNLHPHAYFCITTKEGEKREGKIEEGLDGKERNEVRRLVAERVYLECCKVIGLEPHDEVAKRHKDATIEEEQAKKKARDNDNENRASKNKTEKK